MSNPKYQEIKRAMEQTPIDPIMERVIGDDPLAYQQEFSIGDVRTAVRLGYAAGLRRGSDMLAVTYATAFALQDARKRLIAEAEKFERTPDSAPPPTMKAER